MKLDSGNRPQRDKPPAAAGSPYKPPRKPVQAQAKPDSNNVEVDEMGTIHLIDSLDPESKKVLNSLVQSVLVTQQENDKNKLEMIGKKKALI